MVLLIILTGMFRDFSLFAILLLIHELGHSIMGVLLGWHLNKIKFFPYGGVSEFDLSFNHPLWQELLILVMGPLFQIGAYFVLSILLGNIDRVFQLRIYHNSLLLFNLLPIYPLDGGKLVSLILYHFFPFHKGMKLAIYGSFFLLFFILFVMLTSYRQTNLILILGIVFTKLLQEKRKIPFYYQKFLLERYLDPPFFKKRKVITRIEDMYRDKKHLLFVDGYYKTEREILKKHFEREKNR